MFYCESPPKNRKFLKVWEGFRWWDRNYHSVTAWHNNYWCRWQPLRVDRQLRKYFLECEWELEGLGMCFWVWLLLIRFTFDYWIKRLHLTNISREYKSFSFCCTFLYTSPLLLNSQWKQVLKRKEDCKEANFLQETKQPMAKSTAQVDEKLLSFHLSANQLSYVFLVF